MLRVRYVYAYPVRATCMLRVCYVCVCPVSEMGGDSSAASAMAVLKSNTDLMPIVLVWGGACGRACMRVCVYVCMYVCV